MAIDDKIMGKAKSEGQKMYRHIKTYELRYTDVDNRDKLKLSSLLSIMEESACFSADELGFGYDVLMPNNYGFILVNWYIELKRQIRLGEKLTVATWPIQPKRFIVLRDFELYVGDEKVGVATSRWCLVNLGDFSLLPSDAVFKEGMSFNTERSTNFTSWKIREIEGEPKTYTKFVSWSDYDHYNHVNNTKYADILLDAFSVDEHEKLDISTVQIKYVKQCKYGEELDVSRQSDGENAWIVEGRVGGELRIQMRITCNA